MTFFALLLTALLGSPHCAGMCGGFVGMLSALSSRSALPGKDGQDIVRTAEDVNSWGAFWRMIWYHLGRLSTYCSLGAMAGMVGKGIDIFGAIGGVSRLSVAVVGLWLIVTGASYVFGLRLGAGNWWPVRLANVMFSGPFRWLMRRRGRKISLRVAGSHEGLGQEGLRAAAGGAFAIGATSTLLPCGFLYLFVASAAGAGSVGGGLAVMLALWLGTMPVLIGVGHLSRFISAELQPLVPRITGVLLVSAGIFSLSSHLQATQHGVGHCHEMVTVQTPVARGVVDSAGGHPTGEIDHPGVGIRDSHHDCDGEHLSAEVVP